jgi:GMP synthase-like glutamine amidotransferase
MRFLVIQHDADKGLGLLAAPLRECGVELDVRLAGRDSIELGDHAAVVALPGLADPVDDTAAVRATREVLGAAYRRRLPVLGICLGAELLAEAAGGAVCRCPAEYGYCRISIEPAAWSDPLLRTLPAELEAFQAHGFAVEPPPGAVTLARSARALQAFRLAGRSWGLQFHPEPTVDMLESWLRTIAPELRRNSVLPAEVARRARQQVPLWAKRAREIARGFVQAVAARGEPSADPGH